MNKNKKSIYLVIIFFLVLLIAMIGSGCTSSSKKTITKNNVIDKKEDGFLFPANFKTDGVKKWGYINSEGTFVITPQFDAANDFQENNLAVITINDHQGLINKKGEIVLNPTFDYINDFSEGFAIAYKDSKNSIIDSKGLIVFSSDYSIGNFKNGFAIVSKEMGTKGYNYGYMDKNLKIVAEFIYKSAEDFSDNKALVKIADNKYEIIDNNFKTISTLNHSYMYGLSEDMISFKDTTDSKFGCVNTEGKIIIAPTFQNVVTFKDGLAIVDLSDEDYYRKSGVIDKAGEYVIKPSYSSIEYLGNKLFTATKLSKDYGSPYFAPKSLLDSNGKQLTDFKYFEIVNVQNNMFMFSSNNATYFKVSDDNNTYFINETGRILNNLPKFNGSGTVTFTNGLIKATIDDRLSYVTNSGKTIWEESLNTPLINALSLDAIKYSLNRSLTIFYPQLKGLKDVTIQTKINDAIKKDFVADSKTSEKYDDGGYSEISTVDFEGSQNKDLLIILMTGYVMPNGAAHGMPIKQYYHIDLKTGTSYKLSDLFKSNSNYISKLTAILKAKMEKANKEEDKIYPSTSFTISADQGFYLTKDTLNIYFTPYEIASYAEGYPTFSISYNEIKDIINTEGGFFKSFDKSDIASNPKNVLAEKDSIVETAIDNYEKNIINAINSNDFSLVEDTLIKDSNLYKSQKSLLPGLNKQGIKEKLTGYSITKIKWNEDKTKCMVNVDETISIKYPNKDYVDKRFSYVYTLSYDENNKLLLSDIGKQ